MFKLNSEITVKKAKKRIDLTENELIKNFKKAQKLFEKIIQKVKIFVIESYWKRWYKY